jgi:thiamine biosynthesis lipoprotein
VTAAAKRTWSLSGTTAEVLVTDPRALDAACALAVRRLTAVSDACDRFRPDSELSRLRDRASAGVDVSPVLAALVRVALEAARLTGGAVVPTLGAPQRDTAEDGGIRLVHDRGRPLRANARPRAAWERVHVDGTRLTVPDGVDLDLDVIARAAAADAIAETIADRFGCGALVNLGGDVSARGPAPAGGWQVTVQDRPGDPAAQVALGDGWGLATASAQWRSRPDERLHPILDPRTGRPATPGWRTASVAAPSAVRARTFATAAIVLGPAAGAMLRSAGHPVRLVHADGGLTLLNGWPAEQRAA